MELSSPRTECKIAFTSSVLTRRSAYCCNSTVKAVCCKSTYKLWKLTNQCATVAFLRRVQQSSSEQDDNEGEAKQWTIKIIKLKNKNLRLREFPSLKINLSGQNTRRCVAGKKTKPNIIIEQQSVKSEPSVFPPPHPSRSATLLVRAITQKVPS